MVRCSVFREELRRILHVLVKTRHFAKCLRPLHTYVRTRMLHARSHLRNVPTLRVLFTNFFLHSTVRNVGASHGVLPVQIIPLVSCKNCKSSKISVVYSFFGLFNHEWEGNIAGYCTIGVVFSLTYGSWKYGCTLVQYPAILSSQLIYVYSTLTHSISCTNHP